jgi:LETM1 and EF-hand domain-containing protein 1
VLVITFILLFYQVTQTRAAIGEREGKIDHKTKIEIIKEEVRRIKEEHQEQTEEEKKEIERVSTV